MQNDPKFNIYPADISIENWKIHNTFIALSLQLVYILFIFMYTFIYCEMSVISVRVDKRIKRILEEAGINISEEIKKFLNELAWKIEVRRRIERFDKLMEGIRPTEYGYSTKSVREDRESH